MSPFRAVVGQSPSVSQLRNPPAPSPTSFTKGASRREESGLPEGEARSLQNPYGLLYPSASFAQIEAFQLRRRLKGNHRRPGEALLLDQELTDSAYNPIVLYFLFVQLLFQEEEQEDRPTDPPAEARGKQRSWAHSKAIGSIHVIQSVGGSALRHGGVFHGQGSRRESPRRELSDPIPYSSLQGA
jgi:hypothetical protein